MCFGILFLWRSAQAQLLVFCLWLTCSLAFTCSTEEKRTAQGVRQRLWELLATAGLTEDSGSSPWLHAYRRLLQEEGVDEETQKKAVLMQLWATQVSQSSQEGRQPVCARQEFQPLVTSRNVAIFPLVWWTWTGLRCVRGSFCLHVSEQTWSQTDRDGDTDMEVWQQQYSSLAHECAVHLYHHKSCATRGLQEHKLEDCMMVLDMFLCQ